MALPHVYQISVSQGGVPKLAVASARVTREGVEGDWQNDRKHHGGPDRAVCLFALSVIERLRNEGHPIAPGTAGENVTMGGVTPAEWAALVPGARISFASGVELEILSYCNPCSTIRDSFQNLEFRRIQQDERPGESRLYARVLREGTLRSGDTATISGAGAL